MMTNKNSKESERAFGYKHSKAQHLVELVLFFPFLIGIIGLLTEIAYGLNTGIELNSALNRAVGIVSSVQREKNADLTDIENEIYQNTYNILVARRVPYADTLKVDTLEADDFIVSIATYNYTYAFQLVNLFFDAVPEKFYFKSIALTNKALFAPNSYDIQNNTLTDEFNTYSQTGSNGLNDSINNIFNNYKDKWNKDHEQMWEDYVEKTREEQELAAQEQEQGGGDNAPAP